MIRLWPLVLLLFCTCRPDPLPILTASQQETVQKSLLKKPPQPALSKPIRFGEGVRLLGLDLDPLPLKAGQRFTLTWYWESLAPVDRDWMVFVHIDGEGRRFNLDHHPVKGLYEVRRWKPGQRIRDEQVATLPHDFPAGEAKIWVGLWHGHDRLPVTDGDAKEGTDRVLAATPTVTPKPVPRITIPYAATPPTLDGRLDEGLWSGARGTVNLKALRKRAPNTRVHLRWDEEHLYLGADCTDADVASPFTRDDDDLWKADVVELFLDANGDRKSYEEFQISPADRLFDAAFTHHRSPLPPARRWSSNAGHGVDDRGTLNSSEPDRGWSAELAIPWATLPPNDAIEPKAGHTLRLNLFRLDGKAGGAQKASAWSAPGRPDFHTLDRFGEASLAADKSSTPP